MCVWVAWRWICVYGGGVCYLSFKNFYSGMKVTDICMFISGKTFTRSNILGYMKMCPVYYYKEIEILWIKVMQLSTRVM